MTAEAGSLTMPSNGTMTTPTKLRMGECLAAVVASALCGALAAQQPVCTAAQKADPKNAQLCATSPPPPPASTSQRFPYPGETPEAAPSAPATPGSSAPEAATPKRAGDRFPYPGETSDTPGIPDAPGKDAADTPSKPGPAPARTPQPYPGDPDAAKDAADGFSSSSSSSSSSASDSGAPDASADPLKDAGSSGDDTKSPKGKRRKLPKVDAQTPEEREAEDLEVADFYTKTGNLVGAYARAKDAVTLIPADPAAHFALAELARKTGKPDEARAEYRLVLTLDPNDKQVKYSTRALADLGPGGATK